MYLSSTNSWVPYLYLLLYLRGTVHCLFAYCLVNRSLWWKLGYIGEKASGLISIKIVWAHDNLIYDFLILSDLLWFLWKWKCSAVTVWGHSAVMYVVSVGNICHVILGWHVTTVPAYAHALCMTLDMSQCDNLEPWLLKLTSKTTINRLERRDVTINSSRHILCRPHAVLLK